MAAAVLSQLLLGNSVGLLHRAPDENSEYEISGGNDRDEYLKSKLYYFSVALVFLLAFFLLTWGWWNANYGEGSVYGWMAVAGVGFLLLVASGLVFMLRCCQNP
jgi:hypothetical protein